jgi:hypothetical protein
MLEHDGAIKYGPVTPTGDPYRSELPDVAASGDDPRLRRRQRVRVRVVARASFYAVYEGPTRPTSCGSRWSSGRHGRGRGTAFDFLGDGVAEAMYADEQNFRIYDGMSGQVVLTQPRQLHHNRVPDGRGRRQRRLVRNSGGVAIGDGTAGAPGAARHRRPLDPGAPDLEPARVLCDERPRGLDDPAARDAQLADRSTRSAPTRRSRAAGCASPRSRDC